jgi:hypothetical protein
MLNETLNGGRCRLPASAVVVVVVVVVVAVVALAANFALILAKDDEGERDQHQSEHQQQPVARNEIGHQTADDGERHGDRQHPHAEPEIDLATQPIAGHARGVAEKFDGDGEPDGLVRRDVGKVGDDDRKQEQKRRQEQHRGFHRQGAQCDADQQQDEDEDEEIENLEPENHRHLPRSRAPFPSKRHYSEFVRPVHR